MTCQEAVEWMQRNLDHDLDDSERETMMAHMSRCRDCTEMYARLQQLSLELANLPKVMPPFSLVDSIMPRLEEIDRIRIQDTTEGLTSAASHNIPAAQAGKGWQRRWKRTFPLGAVGGVIAAGVVLTLFMTNETGLMKRSYDETGLMSMEIADRTAKSAPASQGAGKSDDKSSETMKSAGSTDRPTKSNEIFATSSATAPTAPTVPNTSNEMEPNVAEATPTPGTLKIMVPGPTPTPHPGERSGKGGVDISEAGRLPGQTGQGIYDSNANITSNSNADLFNNANTSAVQSETPGPTSSPSTVPFDTKDQSGANVNKSGGGEPATDTNTSGEPSQTDKGESNPPSTSELLPPRDSNRSFGINASTPVVRMESLDNQLVAVYNTETRRVTVAKTSDEAQIVFTSEQQWAEKDLVLLNGWPTSLTFSYTVTQGEVKKSFVIDLEHKKETAVAPAK